jgi:uncharacterized membrane protein
LTLSRDAKVRADETETARLEAFSDGVFAVAITLLVLDLKVPKVAEVAGRGGLLAALLGQWPAFLAYVTSFLTILVMWVNHHTLFTHIRRSNHPFLYLNGMLLLLVSCVPFTTSLLAEHIRAPEASRTAAAVYAGNFVLLAVVFNLLWRYASRGNRLLAPDASAAAVAAITRQYGFGPPLYLLAFALAFVSVPASVGICMALAAFFTLTGVFIRAAEGEC